MINKALVQGLIILVLFFGMFFGLSRIDFVSLFEIKERTASAENNIGDLIWNQFRKPKM